MADLLAIDFAWQQISPQQMIRAGYLGGSLRYISHDGSKDASKVEIENMHEHGLPIALLFESTAGRSREGKQAGITDAMFFNDRLADLGAPDSVGRITTTDFDGGDECLPYYEGWAEICPPSMFVRASYGSGYLVRRLKQLGLIELGWQTLSTGFRESTPVNRRFVDILQRFPSRAMPPHPAGSWDENVIYVKDWGAWYPPGWFTEEEEDEMHSLKSGEYAVIPLRGKPGTVRIAADFQPARVRVAMGKGDGGKPGPITSGYPKTFDVERGCVRLAVTDQTWFSVKNLPEDPAKPNSEVGVTVDYT